MTPQELEAEIRKAINPNSGSRALVSFTVAMVLAYRNLYEQTDTGAILTPQQFTELVISGARATRLEARGTTLRALCPNPSLIDKDILCTNYLMTTVKTTMAEDNAIAEFAALMAKLIQAKPTQGGTVV